MRKRLFPLLIALSALAVSGSAAFYSVFGLSKLFAGASLQVIIMAGSLEFAKLVVASLLYQYWGTINKILRAYLAVAVFVLVLITSGGIYGFLSGAYQETATKSELLDKSLAILNQKQIRFQEVKEDLSIEKTQLNKSISELRISLSNPGSVSYYDKEAEQVITTTSSSTRRALQAELKTTIEDRDNINLKLEAILDSISTTDMALLDKEIGNEAERELGPLKYLAEITGKDMSVVVNWFLLLIIFVFDPLAISMVVAANFAFAQIRRRDDDDESVIVDPQGIDPDDVKMSVPPGLEYDTPYTLDEIKNAFEKDSPSEELKQRVKENQAKLKEREIDDMPEESLEEEKWLPEQDSSNKVILESELEEEFHEGKQMAKGLDTFLEVIEEEEREKEKEKGENEVNQPSTSNTSAEHELYHGTPKPVKPAKPKRRKKSLSANDKRRRKKVVKPTGTPKRTPGYKG